MDCAACFLFFQDEYLVTKHIYAVRRYSSCPEFIHIAFI